LTFFKKYVIIYIENEKRGKVMMNVYELMKQFENDFETFGPNVSLDKPGWKDELPLEIVEAYENGFLIPDWEDTDSIEFGIEDLAKAMCEANGFELIDYVVDKVFDSPGLDVYVASIVIADGDKKVVSYHNVFNRC
jgi:hypothetical protein